MKNNVINCREMFGNDAFCLRNRVEVEDLTIGAKLYGGATVFDNKCFSNCDETTTFDIKPQNVIGILVPTTINVNEPCCNLSNIEKVCNTLEYFGKDCKIKSACGSWMSESGEVVQEMSDVVEFIVEDKDNVEFWLRLAKLLAEEIKIDMKQEAVSIFVNNSLAIV